MEKTIDQRVFILKYKLSKLEKELEAIKQENYFKPLINLKLEAIKMGQKDICIYRESNEINYELLNKYFFSQGFTIIKFTEI